MSWKPMQIVSNPVSAFNVRESPKFSSFFKEIVVEEYDGDVRF